MSKENENNSRYRAFVKKYYPANAAHITVAINSEYNDEGYRNSVKYVVVYDNEGNELPPLKETAKVCRDLWYELPITNDDEDDNGYGTDEPLEDVELELSR